MPTKQQQTPPTEPNRFRRFAVFVAILSGRSIATAPEDFDPDLDASWAAELLLRGDARGRDFFDSRRVARALRFAYAVGLRDA
jgi:hypothetical protein